VRGSAPARIVGLVAAVAALRREALAQGAAEITQRQAFERLDLRRRRQLVLAQRDNHALAHDLRDELAPFAGRIFRTKGILAVAGVDERMILQGVADTVELTFGEPWANAPRSSRLVVVGYALDRGALERGFAACAADMGEPR